MNSVNSYDEAYDAGFSARAQHKTEKDNPYAYMSSKWQRWQRGFMSVCKEISKTDKDDAD